jgi:hypothetical protein
VIATISLVAAVGGNWYGDRQKKDAVPKVLVVHATGELSCGKLERDAEGNIALRINGTPVAVAGADSAEIVDDCPK